MAIYFEPREYTTAEIADILGIKNTKTQLRRTIITKMKNLGFEVGRHYSFPQYSKRITILWIPQTSSEKITYLVRLLGIDTKVDPHAFALFLYGMIITEDLQAMPWEERADWMKDNWDVTISSQTLCRKWGRKLIELGVLTKDKQEGQWWCSFKFEGRTIRQPVTTPEELETVKSYWNDWREWKKVAPYKEVFSRLWSKYGCTYYKCPKLAAGAWNQPIVEELIQTVDDYVQEYWS